MFRNMVDKAAYRLSSGKTSTKLIYTACQLSVQDHTYRCITYPGAERHPDKFQTYRYQSTTFQIDQPIPIAVRLCIVAVARMDCSNVQSYPTCHANLTHVIRSEDVVERVGYVLEGRLDIICSPTNLYLLTSPSSIN